MGIPAGIGMGIDTAFDESALIPDMPLILGMPGMLAGFFAGFAGFCWAEAVIGTTQPSSATSTHLVGQIMVAPRGKEDA